MDTHKWEWDLSRLQHLTQFDESWCQKGQESAWLETLSEAAREALHRYVAKDHGCPEEEMRLICEKLQRLTQLHYFDKVRKTGEDTPETGQRPPPPSS